MLQVTWSFWSGRRFCMVLSFVTSLWHSNEEHLPWLWSSTWIASIQTKTEREDARRIFFVLWFRWFSSFDCGAVVGLLSHRVLRKSPTLNHFPIGRCLQPNVSVMCGSSALCCVAREEECLRVSSQEMSVLFSIIHSLWVCFKDDWRAPDFRPSCTVICYSYIYNIVPCISSTRHGYRW